MGNLIASEQKARFLVFGAGAIGIYIGGSLASAGYRVEFLGHERTPLKLRNYGIHLLYGGAEYHLEHPETAKNLEEALATGHFDCVIFAIKAYDTLAVLAELERFSNSLPPFLCLQNGVGNEVVLGQVLGMERVIAGTVTSAISKIGVGTVQVERFRGMAIAAGNSLVPELVKTLNNAHLNVHICQNANSLKWSKMVTNLVGNATSAILNMTLAEIYADPEIFALEITQLREALQVMKVQRIPVIDLPGAPVRLLALAVRNLPSFLAQLLLTRFLVGSRGGKMPSFHIDLHSGKNKSEVDFLNGAVVRGGEKFRVPTPINRILNQTLLSLTNGEVDWKSFDHQSRKLLELVNQK